MADVNHKSDVRLLIEDIIGVICLTIIIHMGVAAAHVFAPCDIETEQCEIGD